MTSTNRVDRRRPRLHRPFLPAPTEAHGILADGQVGAEDFKVIVPAFRAMMRDMRVSVDRHVEMDEWLWAHVSLHAVTIVGANPVHAVREW